MPIFRSILVVSLCFCVIAGGCHVGTGPRTVATYRPGKKPEVQKATYFGEYALYAVPDNARKPQVGAAPVTSIHLATGDEFGFKRDANGYAVAVAADRAVPLDRQSYIWQMRADPEQIDKYRKGALGTTGIIIGAVVFTLVIAGVAAS